jgi:hypothetical protein|tara:strand:+ start:294 stop:722 length:429 start_codon:yes stop_codon:yes gene_type:complete
MAILQGTAYWVSATTPNTTFEPVYSVNLVVDEDTAQDFQSRGFPVKMMDEGVAVVIKRKVNGPNGMVRPAPRLVDAQKNPLDARVGNGSEVKVQYKEWESEWKGKLFKGLDFQAMQVINLIEIGSPDGSEFDAIDSEMEDEL